jgi:hypothetical protein
MVKRKLRLFACATALVSLGYGCSLTIDTDGLSGGAPIVDRPDSTMTVISDAGVADSAPSGTVCTNGDIVGSSTSCGACGYSCGGGACSDGVCQAVAVATAGQGRAVTVFSTFGIIWSTVTARNEDGADACAAVTPLVWGLAASTLSPPPDGGTEDPEAFEISSSGTSAYYASALTADTSGVFFQDTAPAGGNAQHEVGVGKFAVVATANGAIFGMAEPAGGGAMVYFADSTANPGPHEYGVAGGMNDGTMTLPLDPSAPAELHTPYQTAALALDGTWAYYGTAAGVYRIKLGATCVADAGVDAGKNDAGAAGSSCEGLLVPESTSNPVTVLLVDNQYLYVGTTDGVLTRYDALDGTNPLQLSTDGPFYGLTQDVNTATASVTFGSVVYATSVKGPILELAKDGTGSTTLATSTRTPIGIAVDGDTLYWVENGDTDPSTHCAIGNGRLMRVRHK